MPEIRSRGRREVPDLVAPSPAYRGHEQPRVPRRAPPPCRSRSRSSLRRRGATGGRPSRYVTADLESHVVVLDLATAAIVSADPRPAPGRAASSPSTTGRPSSRTREHGVVTLARRRDEPRCASSSTASPSRATPPCIRARRSRTSPTPRARRSSPSTPDAAASWRARVSRALRGTSRSSPDGRTLWTALGTKAERVAVLDTTIRGARGSSARSRRRSSLTTSSSRPTASRLGHVRRRARIAVYAATAAPDRRSSPPEHRRSTSRSRGAKAFVASGDDGTVRLHRLDGELVREARVPVGSYNVDVRLGRRRHAVARRGTVSVLDATRRVRGRREVARAAHDACIVSAPEGGHS